ncbi:MAG: hypothetical protein HY549_09930 [Elusimicrobia bacterium]|nr:hypothetical protein [Elusimicrobiota bacterium]
MQLPFEQGRELLEKFSGIRISVERGRTIAEGLGSELENLAQEEIARVWRPKAPGPREACRVPERLCLSPDGTHIPIRGQREQTRYVAGPENAERFYQRLYVEALKQGLDEAKEVIVLGDGAEWIWNQAELTLPKNRVEIIDYRCHEANKAAIVGVILSVRG